MANQRQAWTRKLLDAPHEVPDKAVRIQKMFDRLAPRYELVNSLFSTGRDAAWRRKAVELAIVDRTDKVLDVACGTGDFARAFATAGVRMVVGCDFSHEMLLRAACRPAKHRAIRPGPLRPGRRHLGGGGQDRGLHSHSSKAVGLRGFWCEGDALHLPFRSGSFSIVSCAFGVRNFQDLDAGLAEMFRVLEPGGRAVILEFTRPHNRLARAVYETYAHLLMPVAATLISGDRSGAYRYLPRSVVSFLDAEQLCSRLSAVGFALAETTPLTMGIVTVCVAKRDG